MEALPILRAELFPLLRRLPARVVLVAAMAGPALATTFHVDSHATPGGDGLSWATAFKSLDDALAASQANLGPDEIWLAQGRYRPSLQTTSDPRAVTFTIPHNTTLRGGFLGTETSLPPLGSPRSTILTGDIGIVGLATDNAYHVVTCQSVNGTLSAAIDGCTIRDGRADGGDARGGGLFVNGGVFGLNLAISRCIVRDNTAGEGGGMFYQSAHVRMTKCTFEHNAANKGGALRAQAAYMRCDNSRFRQNTAVNGGCGITLNGNPSPDTVFMNCLFTENSCTLGSGGAAYMIGGQFSAGAAMWVNCTFAQNSAAVSGSAVYAGPPTTVPAVAILRNCVAWNNSPATSTLEHAWEVSYSDIEGGWVGTGNISADPLLTPSFGLGAGSPAIDAGSDNLVLTDTLDLDQNNDTTELVPLDLDGHPRQMDDPNTIDTGVGVAPIVDMGAFEAP
jgi:hypothetical protein